MTKKPAGVTSCLSSSKTTERSRKPPGGGNWGQAGASTTLPLWPPKPNELDMEMPGSQGAGAPVTKFRAGMSGSGVA